MNFIRLENSLEKAMAYRNGADMRFFIFTGVQLLPNDVYPYIQTTKSSDGIELEDWTVSVMSICGEELQDISDYFNVVENFQDPDTGLPQISWELRNVPFDFGRQLVYLKIDQLNGDTFYTSPFELTNEDREYTSRLDYRNDTSETMQSSRVQMYFRQNNQSKEYTQYYEVSTKRTRTNVIKSQSFENWRIKIMPVDNIINIINANDYRYMYLDLKRAFIFEAVEIPMLEGDENFAESDISFSFDGSDIYDPNYIAPTPPAPPVPENPPQMEITFLRRTFNSGMNYDVFFTIDNFDPSYVAIQASNSGAPYFSNTGGVEIPRVVNLGSQTSPTYFRLRLYHEGSGLYSKNMANILAGGNQLFGIIQEKISNTQYKFTLFFDEKGARQTLNLKINTPSGEFDSVESNSTGIEKTVNITTGQAVTFTISNPEYTSSMTILAQTNN